MFFIGLANGWADREKVVFIHPSEAAVAYQDLILKSCPIKGFMFWVS